MTLVAVSALVLAACGGSGASQEELNHARKEAANHVHKEERLRKLEKELKHIKGGGSNVTTPGTAPAPTTSTPTSSSCGGELTVGASTTCPFAENVESTYFEEIGSGGGTIEAYSPVTERFYSMYCTPSPHECTGGNNASVFFP
jgi:hypothetical protein